MLALKVQQAAFLVSGEGGTVAAGKLPQFPEGGENHAGPFAHVLDFAEGHYHIPFGRGEPGPESGGGGLGLEPGAGLRRQAVLQLPDLCRVGA